jgi:hypothetical protein
MKKVTYGYCCKMIDMYVDNLEVSILLKDAIKDLMIGIEESLEPGVDVMRVRDSIKFDRMYR